MKSKPVRAKPIPQREIHRAAKANAMPDVKALVKTHGLRAVAACVQDLRAYNKELREFEEAAASLKNMAKRLRGKK